MGADLTGWPHFGCAAHTIQLSVNVGLAHSTPDKAIAIARKLVGHFKHSVVATTASLQGHPLECCLYSPPCASDFLYLQILAPHFPAIRRIVMNIYELWRNDTKITEIETALQHGHLAKILEIVNEARTDQLRQYDVSAEVLIERTFIKLTRRHSRNSIKDV